MPTVNQIKLKNYLEMNSCFDESFICWCDILNCASELEKLDGTALIELKRGERYKIDAYCMECGLNANKHLIRKGKK